MRKLVRERRSPLRKLSGHSHSEWGSPKMLSHQLVQTLMDRGAVLIINSNAVMRLGCDFGVFDVWRLKTYKQAAWPVMLFRL